MDILGTQVLTPFADVDDPAAYAVGWRRAAAAAYTAWQMTQAPEEITKATEAAKENKLVLTAPGLDGRIAADPYIVELVRFLVLTAVGVPNAGTICPMPRMAIGWDENVTGKNTKQRLNAMLLAPDCPIETVAVFHGVSPDCVKFYERTCWNVRNEDWSHIACRAVAMGEAYNHGLEIRANTPASQRILVDADRFGFAIMSMRWGIHQMGAAAKDPDALPKLLEQTAQAEMLHKLANGTAQGMDIVAMMGHGIDRKKLEIEAQAQAVTGSSSAELARKMLMLCAPKLIVALRSDAEKIALQTAVGDKLSSERKVKAIKIEDRGVAAGYAAMDKKIRNHVQDPRQVPLPAQVADPAKDKAGKKARAK